LALVYIRPVFEPTHMGLWYPHTQMQSDCAVHCCNASEASSNFHLIYYINGAIQ